MFCAQSRFYNDYFLPKITESAFANFLKPQAQILADTALNL
jgi:hypothetical protein